MIAADTSAWVDYSKDSASAACARLERALWDGNLVLPMPVYFEITSGPALDEKAAQAAAALPKLDMDSSFWERAGLMRQSLLKKGLKAQAMDCLIAQSCIDHKVPLITSDEDFRKFLKFGLKLA